MRLELAETFVIARESSDTVDLVEVGSATTDSSVTAKRRRSTATARRRLGDRLARRRSRGCSGTIRGRSTRSTRGCPEGEQAARGAVDAALHDLCAKQAGVSRLPLARASCPGPPTSWTIWLGDPDDMARRAEAVSGRFRRLKLKLGGRDGLDVERVRAVRGDRRAAAGRRERVLVAGRGA